MVVIPFSRSFLLAVERAGAIARQADVVTAMTVQVLRGSAAPYRIGLLPKTFDQLFVYSF